MISAISIMVVKGECARNEETKVVAYDTTLFLSNPIELLHLMTRKLDNSTGRKVYASQAGKDDY
jgi:hypothetical protein